MDICREGTRCWTQREAKYDRVVAYLNELVIAPEWRGKGIGSWVLPRLFLLRQLRSTNFIYTFPNVLNYLEPPSVNWPLGKPTAEEKAAHDVKRIRIEKFYRKVILSSLIFRAGSDCFVVVTHHHQGGISPHGKHTVLLLFEEPCAPLTLYTS